MDRFVDHTWVGHFAHQGLILFACHFVSQLYPLCLVLLNNHLRRKYIKEYSVLAHTQFWQFEKKKNWQIFWSLQVKQLYCLLISHFVQLCSMLWVHRWVKHLSKKFLSCPIKNFNRFILNWLNRFYFTLLWTNLIE